MIRSLPAIPLAILMLGLPALAQDKDKDQGFGEGLDLSGDSKPEEKKPESKPAETAKPPPSAPAGADKSAEAKGDADASTTTPTDVSKAGDTVISRQRKLYMKERRVEASAFISVSVNDPYYQKWGGNFRLAFYPADSLAIAGRFSLLQVLPTDDVRVAKRDFQSRIFFSEPEWMAMGDIEWSPFYGKVAFMNSILHVDAHVIAGMGAVYTATVVLKDRTVAIGADLGIGLRFVVVDWLAVTAQLINTSYVDQPAGTTKGAVQNLMMFNVGFSIFIPFKSTFREAE